MTLKFSIAPADTSSMSIIPFKERSAVHGQRVRVYLNLHKSVGKPGSIDKPWYSVVDQATGQVIAHADRLVLDDAHFTINEAGRDKVRATKRKNVHAWISGSLNLDGDVAGGDSIFYDPYRVDHFVIAGTDRRVERADRVLVHGPGVQALAVA